MEQGLNFVGTPCFRNNLADLFYGVLSTAAVLLLFAIWFSLLFDPSSRFELPVVIKKNLKLHIRSECQNTWKYLQLTIKTICCGSFRVALERPGWCPDPHKPPCAG